MKFDNVYINAALILIRIGGFKVHDTNAFFKFQYYSEHTMKLVWYEMEIFDDFFEAFL